MTYTTKNQKRNKYTMRIPLWHGTRPDGSWKPGLKFKLERLCNRIRSRFGWDPFKDE